MGDMMTSRNICNNVRCQNVDRSLTVSGDTFLSDMSSVDYINIHLRTTVISSLNKVQPGNRYYSSVNSVPQINSPQINSPQISSPQLNSPSRLYSITDFTGQSTGSLVLASRLIFIKILCCCNFLV